MVRSLLDDPFPLLSYKDLTLVNVTILFVVSKLATYPASLLVEFTLVEKNVSATCHLLRFFIYAAINRKKNLEKKNLLNVAVSSLPAANKH